MATKPDYQKQNEGFVAKLLRECNDRGTRAELRRYWSDRTRHYAYPVLGRLDALGEKRKPFAYTAAFYAIHHRDGAPAHRAGGHPVGRAFLTLAGNSPKATAYESTERHFRRLLASESLDDLAAQLHRFVKRLERERIALDYVCLLKDLWRWEFYAEDVKTDWALDFWQATPESETEPSDAA